MRLDEVRPMRREGGVNEHMRRVLNDHFDRCMDRRCCVHARDRVENEALDGWLFLVRRVWRAIYSRTSTRVQTD